MNDQAQHILGAADSAHQGIELARSLLQESLENMREILTQGCGRLGLESLGSTVRLGQGLEEFSFLLEDLQKDAHGLCVLLGHDLGVCEGEVTVLSPGPERPSDAAKYRHDMFGEKPADMMGEELGTPDYRDLLFAEDDDDEKEDPEGHRGFFQCMDDSEDLGSGRDEFDDDEQPF